MEYQVQEVKRVPKDETIELGWHMNGKRTETTTGGECGRRWEEALPLPILDHAQWRVNDYAAGETDWVRLPGGEAGLSMYQQNWEIGGPIL